MMEETSDHRALRESLGIPKGHEIPPFFVSKGGTESSVGSGIFTMGLPLILVAVGAMFAGRANILTIVLWIVAAAWFLANIAAYGLEWTFVGTIVGFFAMIIPFAIIAIFLRVFIGGTH